MNAPQHVRQSESVSCSFYKSLTDLNVYCYESSATSFKSLHVDFQSVVKWTATNKTLRMGMFLMPLSWVYQRGQIIRKLIRGWPNACQRTVQPNRVLVKSEGCRFSGFKSDGRPVGSKCLFSWEQTDKQDLTAPLKEPTSQHKTLSLNITINV